MKTLKPQIDISQISCGPLVASKVDELVAKGMLGENNGKLIKDAAKEDNKREIINAASIHYTDKSEINDVITKSSTRIASLKADILDATSKLQEKTGYDLVDLIEYIKWRFDYDDTPAGDAN